MISQVLLDPNLPGFFRLVQPNKVGQATSDLPGRFLPQVGVWLLKFIIMQAEKLGTSQTSQAQALFII